MATRKRPPNSSADDAARADDATRDIAVLLQIALYHGADIEMIRAALRDGRSGSAKLVRWQSPPNIDPPSAA